MVEILPLLSSEVVKLAVGAASSWRKRADAATEDQRDYQEKLENAPADNVFRYVFLINNAAVEKYVSQSRAQAEASFLLSRRAGIAGFALLLGSIVIGLVYQRTDHPLDIAYLSAVAGAITQFLSGVFFWLYNRTLQQINLFYQGIMSQQTEALAAIGRVSEAAREAEKGRSLAKMITTDVESPDAEREP
jgi:Cyanobacterial TRADD-N associated 2-Transmembrane domain